MAIYRLVLRDEPDELIHYGVKGMKWGVIRERIRARKERKRQEKTEEKRLQEETKKRVAMSKRPLASLTDDELRERIYRLELEKRVVELEKSMSGQEQKYVSKGKEVMNNLGNQVLNSAISGIGAGVKSAITKKVKDALESSLSNSDGDKKKNTSKPSGKDTKPDSKPNDKDTKPDSKSSDKDIKSDSKPDTKSHIAPDSKSDAKPSIKPDNTPRRVTPDEEYDAEYQVIDPNDKRRRYW